MKWSLVLAPVLVALAWGCNDEGDEYGDGNGSGYNGSGSYSGNQPSGDDCNYGWCDGGITVSSDASVASGDDGGSANPDGGSALDDAGPDMDTDGGGGGATTTACVPNAVCGGIDSCLDDCFGARCCQLVCDCSGAADDPSSHLKCQLSCTK